MTNKIEQYFEAAQLDSRTRFAISRHLGVDGTAWTYRAIGASLKVSRQRAEQIVRDGAKALGERWDELVQMLPKPASKRQVEDAERKRRVAIREYFREPDLDKPVNYAAAHKACGVEAPRVVSGPEQAQCLALMEDYGLRYFGRWRWCRNCREILPRDSFYCIAGGTHRLYSICKSCNTERCAEYVENNREEVNRKRREWQQANPDKVREATRRYWENRKSNA